MLRKFALGLFSTASMLAVAPAYAGCDIPFRLNTQATLNGAASLQCTGPWGRASSCVNLTPNLSADQFYCSENTIFSNKGEWSCTVSTNNCSSFIQNVYVTDFCVTNDDPVNISVVGASAPLVDHPSAPCSSTSTTAFLGHTPQSADVDSYVWRGKGGTPFVVRLQRDRTGGSSDGASVRLQVFAGNTEIGQDSGNLPLSVSGKVPASGVMTIKVSEVPGDKAFRGAYRVFVKANGLQEDRTLEPMDDVEP